MKICGIYRITNTITGDFYIGSSKDIKRRWKEHKCKSSWGRYPNNPMYQDFQKFGLNNFAFEILAEVEIDSLKETEQKFIEMLNPTYNSNNAKGHDVERYKQYYKEYQKSEKYKEYQKSDKYQESHRKASNKYQKSERGKKYQKEYQKKYNKEYKHQLCCFNGEILTLCALSARFRRQGIDHPTLEAKKYLIQ